MQKTALLSVYDKTGLLDFARGLRRAGYRLLSSGGTSRALREAGIATIDVSAVTNFPELMNGRVKTLHPKIHGGILARRDHVGDAEELAAQEIDTIDLVCVNLYPFAEVLRQGGSEEALIENIDIGGPAMLRSAAKNFRAVWAVSDPSDYEAVLEAIRMEEAEGDPSAARLLRRRLAVKVFRLTQSYDALIASAFEAEGEKDDPDFPDELTLTAERRQILRYGENPHQKAAFYRFKDISDSGLAAAEQLHGKELSYNNIQDANAALELLYEFTAPCVVAVKHMNPCGLATAEDIDSAWRAAYAADPVSIFGGIVVANRPVTAAMAQEMHAVFLEIIAAPDFEAEALEILRRKKNLRLLKLPMEAKASCDRLKTVSVMDGLLVQERDSGKLTREDCTLMTAKAPSDTEWRDLIDGFAVVKHCKSNAIVVFKDGVTLGIGVGQSNRVGAAKLALEQAGELARGAVLASDAFFPMPDTVELAADYGITSVIQPGGSIRDKDSVAACNAHGIAMVGTGIRHFKH